MTRITLSLLSLIFISGPLFLNSGPLVSSQSGRPALNAVQSAANAAQTAANAAAIPANIARPIRPGVIPRITQKTINENDRRQKIVISARYPQISGVAAANDFNFLAEQLVRRHISDFKGDLDSPDPDTRNRELDISYKTALLDSRLISIGFGASKDWGGVHPGSFSFVLNYRLTEQSELNLYDLFRSDSGYLETLSDYCIRRLKNQMFDYESLRDGAAPTLNNYDSWLITKAGLSITFDAYQVGSYAEGPKTVLVPWAKLRKHVIKSGPVSHLSK